MYSSSANVIILGLIANQFIGWLFKVAFDLYQYQLSSLLTSIQVYAYGVYPCPVTDNILIVSTLAINVSLCVSQPGLDRTTCNCL